MLTAMNKQVQASAEPAVRLALATQHAKALSLHQINQLLLTAEVHSVRTIKDANDVLAPATGSSAALSVEDWTYAEEALKRNAAYQVHAIPLNSPVYPPQLKAIPNPPSALYVRGNLDLLRTAKLVSVVGTRQPTESGIEIARRIGIFLTQHDWVVVSGLALGIDASAHRGAIEGSGKTVAVLAHGLHKASPKANQELGEQILATGGTWVSEHPVGIEPRKEFFVNRTRIQVGLSAGSIIVECNERSGTFTQAQYGLGQNREIFAVLPNKNRYLPDLNISGSYALVEFYGAHRLG